MAADDLDPVRGAKFTFSPSEPVAAAGSCFAQHIARHLKQAGYNYLQTEEPLSSTEPLFSARFGNIYTVRQLRQLLMAAYGLHRPETAVWRRKDGRFIDPLRPQLFPQGFFTADDVVQQRRTHLSAVRRVFQECRVFVFTLGLTEAWLAPDGTALPVPPGVLGAETPDGDATFHNFTVAEMRADMDAFLADLFAVNPDVRVILTVSAGAAGGHLRNPARAGLQHLQQGRLARGGRGNRGRATPPWRISQAMKSLPRRRWRAAISKATCAAWRRKAWPM